MKMVTNLLLTCSFLFSRGEIDQEAGLLEWHKRHAIALGIAKGLRFLHEECRAGPIIHRDLRPSNVLLTHDFVPMLSWKALDLTSYWCIGKCKCPVCSVLIFMSYLRQLGDFGLAKWKAVNNSIHTRILGQSGSGQL
jgi:interleukin-1 receptor-associated kinase 1